MFYGETYEHYMREEQYHDTYDLNLDWREGRVEFLWYHLQPHANEPVPTHYPEYYAPARDD